MKYIVLFLLMMSNVFGETIPKEIHYIWFTAPLPQRYADNIIAMAKKNPDYRVNLWLDTMDRISNNLRSNLLRENVSLQVVNFDELLDQELNSYVQGELKPQEQDLVPNPAAASDTVRLALLERYGGIYFDTDIERAHSLNSIEAEYGFLMFNDYIVPRQNVMRIDNCIVAASVNNPIIKELMEEIRIGYAYGTRREGNGEDYDDELLNSISPQDFWRAKLLFGKDPELSLRLALESRISGPVIYYDVIQRFVEGLSSEAIENIMTNHPHYGASNTGPQILQPAYSRLFRFPRGNLLHKSERSWMNRELLTPVKTAAVKKSCAFCQKEPEKIKKCSRCKNAFYCNRYCQEEHWLSHKNSCRKH